MSGTGRDAIPALARRHEVLADSGATHTIAEEERMTKGNDPISRCIRIDRQYAWHALDNAALPADRWFGAMREVDDPRREMEELAHLYASHRGHHGAWLRTVTIEVIEVIAALHDMDVDAEAMVARAEAETNPLGLTVIEGGGGGSPPTGTPPAAA